MKKLANLNGVKALNKNVQRSILGGKCYPYIACEGNTSWSFGQCSCVSDDCC